VTEMDAQIRGLGPSPLRTAASPGLDSFIERTEATTNEDGGGHAVACSIRDTSPTSPGSEP